MGFDPEPPMFIPGWWYEPPERDRHERTDADAEAERREREWWEAEHELERGDA